MPRQKEKQWTGRQSNSHNKVSYLCSCMSLCVPSPQLNKYLSKTQYVMHYVIAHARDGDTHARTCCIRRRRRVTLRCLDFRRQPPARTRWRGRARRRVCCGSLCPSASAAASLAAWRASSPSCCCCSCCRPWSDTGARQAAEEDNDAGRGAVDERRRTRTK